MKRTGLVAISVLAMLASTTATADDAAAPAAAPADRDLAKEDEETQEADETGTGKTLQERIRAVSRRVFLKRQRFELVPLFGFTTNDPLNRAWSFGGRASWHFNEELAIDVGGGGGFNQQLQDLRILNPDEDAPFPTGQPQIGYADAGVTFSPFYGKLALMAEQVAHFDGFISGGLGAVFTETGSIVNPAFEIGLGTRVFLSRWLTLRADLRNYTYTADVGGKLTFPNSLIVSIGAGIHFPLDFDYSSEVIGGKE
ncbi:MAG: outer membrane beta-barrel domain-containing protein [Deltaproteobacteria bacterium]|nr:outer membrane beta-barrel domain-containing protein [Deltaproteobacteria bacterium]